MREYFKAEPNYDGSNWLIADFGTGVDGEKWTLTTNSVHASDMNAISGGAEGDCKLVAELLNQYYNAEDESHHDGLTLATLCDMLLGENAADRSDDALIRRARELLTFWEAHQ